MSTARVVNETHIYLLNIKYFLLRKVKMNDKIGFLNKNETKTVNIFD